MNKSARFSTPAIAVAVGGLAVAAVAAVAAQLFAPPAVIVPAAAGDASPSSPASSSTTASADGSWSRAIDTSPAGPVQWRGGELHADFDDEPLPQAIAELAHATNTRVNGEPPWHAPAPVRMHWRVADAAAGWKLLLRDRARFNVACDDAGCQLWILDETIAAPPAKTTRAPADDTSAPATPPAVESQPDGAC